MPDGYMARKPLRIGLPPGAELAYVELECSKVERTAGEDSIEFVWPHDKSHAFGFGDGPGDLAEFKPGRVYRFSISEKTAPE
jgi:hypothetical protein